MKPIKYVALLMGCITQYNALAQIGKDGARTISAANTIVNEYTYLTANASAGATTLTVNSNNLNTNSRFSGALAQGDLIMIIQMQGASINATVSGTFSLPNDNTWGAVTAYNNSGNYEFAQVLSVSGSTTITILCGLKNDYTSSGHVQIVRVPRYTTLTINSSLTAETWDGNKGGIVSVEVQGATTFGGGSIVTTGLGFRGGALGDNVAVYGGTAWGSSNSDEGAEKGEGIAGFTTEYTPINARYCRGAPANGGGGGNGHNNGGGGGANAGTIATYTGYGIPNTTYNSAWNLEVPALGGTSSSGGGRGGNSFSSNNQNATTLAPNDPSWGGDYNRNNGGQGGRPLDYSTGKLFIGGGGGAGDQNDGDAGAGGRGGGMVFIMSYGTVGGTGSIIANGSNGSNSDISSPPFGGYAGIDGAGGAGGGGTVVINSNGSTSGITINANGGTGGNSNFAPGAFASSTYNAAYGPGGGGGGGYIAISSGTPTRTATGGSNGTTNSSGFTEFPPKGATSGSNGLPTENIANYYFSLANVTICYGTSTTLTATITGTVPSGVTLNWYATQFGTTALGSGTSFTTPTLTTTTTYYVGFCPGHYRLPVTVTVRPQIVINTAAIVLTNETCAGNNGSITGITATGGTGTLSYSWNGGAPSSTANITSLTAGSYTLTVTDAAGCTATTGPYTLTTTGGPIINTSGITITNASCASSSDGSISGITVSGGTGTLSYTWNGTPAAGPTLTSVPSGSYTLQVTDGAGCTVSAGPFTVGTSGGPIINSAGVTITNSTCGNNNGSISGITVSGGTGTLTYTWNSAPAAGPGISSVAAGSYTLVVTDASGCSGTAGPFVISNNGGVTINASGIVIVDATCGSPTGSITGITATSSAGGLTYSWNGTLSASADLTSTAGGSYTLIVQDAVGCSDTAGAFIVNNIGAPVINTSSLNVNGTTCGLNNGTITGITASGGSGTLSYDWNGTSFPSADLTPSASGSYTLTVTDASGCSATAGPFTIASSNTLTATASGTNVSCFGLSDGAALGGVIGGNGTISYAWISGPATQNNTGLSAGTYQVVVSDSQGCSDTASVTITQPPSINPSITGTNTICAGQTTTLTATGGGTYSWSTSETTSSIVASPVTTTTYTVDVTNGACTETATFVVTVNPLPTANVSGTTILCEGQSTTLTASGGSTYVWSDASTSSSLSISPTATTTYYVVAQNACGADTAYITVNVGGAFTTDAGPDQTIGLGNSATISASGGVSFVWTPSSDLSCSTCQTTTASPTVTTTYTVTATSASGCTATDEVTIIVDATQALFVPDIFAPNGNGVNDILFVRGSGIQDLTFKVYDRWGQKVFETTDINSGWDGTFRGKPLDTGVFVYTLEGSYYSGESFSLKGNVTLKR